MSYKNPSHHDFDDSDCDPRLIGAECDTHLRFCFRPPGYYSSAIGEHNCPLGERLPGSVGGDNIRFSDMVGNLDNPFSISVQGSWLVSHFFHTIVLKT